MNHNAAQAKESVTAVISTKAVKDAAAESNKLEQAGKPRNGERVLAASDKAAEGFETTYTTLEGVVSAMKSVYKLLKVYAPPAVELVAMAAKGLQPVAIAVPGLVAALEVVHVLITLLQQVQCNSTTLRALGIRCVNILNIIEEHARRRSQGVGTSNEVLQDQYNKLNSLLTDKLKEVGAYAERYTNARWLGKAVYAWKHKEEINTLRHDLDDLLQMFTTATGIAIQAGVDRLLQQLDDVAVVEEKLNQWIAGNGGVLKAARAMLNPFERKHLFPELQTLADMKGGVELNLHMMALAMLSELYADSCSPEGRRGPHYYIKHHDMRCLWFQAAQGLESEVKWTFWWSHWFPLGITKVYDQHECKQLKALTFHKGQKTAFQLNLNKGDSETKTISVYEVDDAFPQACNIVAKFKELTARPGVVPPFELELPVRLSQEPHTISSPLAAHVASTFAATEDPSCHDQNANARTAVLAGSAGSGVHTVATGVATAAAVLGVVVRPVRLDGGAPHSSLIRQLSPALAAEDAVAMDHDAGVSNPEDRMLNRLASLSIRSASYVQHRHLKGGIGSSTPIAVAEGEVSGNWKVLLIVSNAEAVQSDDACKRLLSRIEAELPTVRTLLLTTEPLNLGDMRCRPYTLQAWSTDSARKLVLQTSPELPEAEFARMEAICLGSPLLLRLFADLLQSGLIDEQAWQEVQQKLGAAGFDRSARFQEVLSFVLARLPVNQQDALSALSIFKSAFTVHDAAVVMSRSESYVSGMLQVLLRHGLVHTNSASNMWELHPSVRGCARDSTPGVTTAFTTYMVNEAQQTNDAYETTRSALLLHKCMCWKPNLQHALKLMLDPSILSLMLSVPSGDVAMGAREAEVSDGALGVAAAEVSAKLQKACLLMTELGIQHSVDMVLTALEQASTFLPSSPQTAQAADSVMAETSTQAAPEAMAEVDMLEQPAGLVTAETPTQAAMDAADEVDKLEQPAPPPGVPDLWHVEEVLGFDDDEEGHDPAAAPHASTLPPRTWESGPQHGNIIKRLFGRRDRNAVYLYNYTRHDAMVVYVPWKQVQQTEGSISAHFHVSATRVDVGFTKTGTREYVDHQTSYQLLKAAQGSDPGKLVVQLPEGCDRTYVTIHRADDAKRVWVKDGLLEVRQCGRIYADPVLLA